MCTYVCTYMCIFMNFISTYIYPQTFQIILGVGILEYLNHDGKVTMVDMHKDSDREVGQFSNPIYGASQLKGNNKYIRMFM